MWQANLVACVSMRFTNVGGIFNTNVGLWPWFLLLSLLLFNYAPLLVYCQKNV